MGRYSGAMHITRLRSKRKDGREYLTVLVAQSYRQGGKVNKRTICNITHLPEHIQSLIEGSLKGSRYAPINADNSPFLIKRSLSHGDVVAVVSMMNKLGFKELLHRSASKSRTVAFALIASQLLFHTSKLASIREMQDSTLLKMLNIPDITVNDLYEAMDFLGENQVKIERRLARKHLEQGSVALYDLTSSYFEGIKCPLAKYGYSRDQKKGLLQVEFGVMTNKEGIPVGVDVFEGNTLDSKTVPLELERLRKTYNLKSVVIVGDRGMLTKANIDSIKELGGIDFITALKRPAIKKLLRNEAFQPSLFDKLDIAEITSDDYENERLMVCKNPFTSESTKITREKIITALENKLAPLIKSVEAGTLVGTESIAKKVGELTARNRARKYLDINCANDSITISRNESLILEEEKLDGFYIVRTSLSSDEMDTNEVVETYKGLKEVEHVFHTLKSVDLNVRPIRHWNESRVRSHIFLCTLSYYVQWHLEDRLKSLLFADEAKPTPINPVVKKTRSQSGDSKAQLKKTNEGYVIQSFTTLLKHLSSLRSEIVEFKDETKNTSHEVEMLTEPTEIQSKVFELLGITPMGNVVKQTQNISNPAS